MKKIQAVFYTFEEMMSLLRRCCFTNGEDFEMEVVDHYFGEINYSPDDLPDD